jgi:hypothetical protein
MVPHYTYPAFALALDHGVTLRLVEAIMATPLTLTSKRPLVVPVGYGDLDAAAAGVAGDWRRDSVEGGGCVVVAIEQVP